MYRPTTETLRAQGSTTIDWTCSSESSSTSGLAVVTDTEKAVLLPYLVVISLLGLLNLSVLVTICKLGFGDNAVYQLLSCQALCDCVIPFIYGAIAVTFIESHQYAVGDALTQLSAVLGSAVSSTLPVHILTLLSVERYVYICRPLRYSRYFTTGKLWVYLAAMILLVTTASVYSAKTYIAVPLDAELFFFYEVSLSNPGPFLFHALVYGILPSGMQGFCFYSILRTAVKQGQRIHNETTPENTGIPDSFSKRQHILRSAAVVARLCGIYWVTWFPAGIMMTLNGAGYFDTVPSLSWLYIRRYIFLVTKTVVPVLNPVVCIWTMTKLRTKWLEMVTRQKHGDVVSA